MKVYNHFFMKKVPALFLGVVWKKGAPCGVIAFDEDGYAVLATDAKGEKEGLLRKELLDAFVEGFIKAEGNGRVMVEYREEVYIVDYFGMLNGDAPDSIGIIDTEDGRIIYAVNYFPGVAEVFARGDFTEGEIRRLLNKAFKISLQNIVRG